MAVRHTEAIAEDVERVLGAVLPAIDLVDVRVVPGGVLRVLIDHPGGVDHERCAEVGRALVSFRERYALEVSSPGIPRPLTKPAHYERFRGRDRDSLLLEGFYSQQRHGNFVGARCDILQRVLSALVAHRF